MAVRLVGPSLAVVVCVVDGLDVLGYDWPVVAAEDVVLAEVVLQLHSLLLPCKDAVSPTWNPISVVLVALHSFIHLIVPIL